MKLTTILGTACAAVLFATVSGHADTLALYPFTGSSPASTDTNANSTASSIGFGSGLSTTDTRYAASAGDPAPALRINADETAGSFAASSTAGDDFFFTLAPVGTGQLELQTLNFDLFLNTALLTSNVTVVASLDGGATFTGLGSVTGFSTTTVTPESFSLASLSTSPGTSVLLAFVVSDNLNSTLAYTGFDNIAVTGTVVPEPGTWAICTLGAVAVGWVARTSRRSKAKAA